MQVLSSILWKNTDCTNLPMPHSLLGPTKPLQNLDQTLVADLQNWPLLMKKEGRSPSANQVLINTAVHEFSR